MTEQVSVFKNAKFLGRHMYSAPFCVKTQQETYCKATFWWIFLISNDVIWTWLYLNQIKWLKK